MLLKRVKSVSWEINLGQKALPEKHVLGCKYLVFSPCGTTPHYAQCQIPRKAFLDVSI